MVFNGALVCFSGEGSEEGWEVGYVVEFSCCLGRFLNRRLYLVFGFVLMGTNLLAESPRVS